MAEPRLLLLAGALLLVGAGCKALPDDPMPEFQLVDLNPGSSRAGQTISPRDYLEQVSGWYFIHAT